MRSSMSSEAKYYLYFKPMYVWFADLVNIFIMKRLKIEEFYSSDAGFDAVPDIKRIFDR